MRGVNHADAMRRILSSSWIADCNGRGLPQGRWAVVEASTHTVVGGVALLLLPPTEEDLEIGWQVARPAWGRDRPIIKGCKRFRLIQLAMVNW
jgi:hypothetical protein